MGCYNNFNCGCVNNGRGFFFDVCETFWIVLIIAIVIINCIAGIAGASSAGLVLAAPVLQTLMPLTNPAVLHRTVVLASLGLDSLPNAGFLQTECTLAGVKFKDVYLPVIFVLTVVLTLARAFLYIGLSYIFGMA